MTSTCRSEAPAGLAFVLAGMLLAACDLGGNGVPKLDYPAMDSEGFQVFSRWCADCHRPPMPSRHDAAGWEKVVRRMQRHRVERGLGPIPDRDRAALLAYLAAHAGKEAR
ncbi:MAG: hypothetical protein R8K47_00990 [Mariprofundaceae bacterium]